jgi:hypothetical protein
MTLPMSYHLRGLHDHLIPWRELTEEYLECLAVCSPSRSRFVRSLRR